MLELTMRCSGITTSPRARSGVAADKAADRAKANLRYIDRASARMGKGALGAGNMRNPDGSRVRSPAEGRAAMRRAIDTRSAMGGKNGRRVAEKLIFSLPNDFSGKPAREALKRIMWRLVGDSEAIAYGVIHMDRPDNLHCHVLAVDGLESLASAKQRRPGAKRVRRRDHLAMNERGKPRVVRALIAEEINKVAIEYGLTQVEHRSFEERGISREPGTHIGPQQMARLNRERSDHRDYMPQTSQKGARQPPTMRLSRYIIR